MPTSTAHGSAGARLAPTVETEKVVQRKREEMMQAELERYMAHAIGHKPKGRMYATTMHQR